MTGKYMKNRIRKNAARARRGFTLVEVAVVLVIISILAAIAAPSIYSFIMSGQQTNRANIARTLYLAAQSQLTQLRVTGGLPNAAATDGPVYIQNGGTITPHADERPDQYNNVWFIRKAAGAPMPPLMDRLFSSIVNKDILDAAVLIEFNIATGTVLSVFYGDGGQTQFEYEYTDDNRNGVDGGRGMDADGYQHADARRQGFYGVTNTGVIDLTEEPTIELYDSFRENAPNLPGGNPGPNVLYADITIPINWNTGMLNLSANGILLASIAPNITSPVYNTFLSADVRIIQHQLSVITDENFVQPGRKRFILVLDQVYGETMNTNASHFRISDFIAPGVDPGDIQLLIEAPNGSNDISNMKHPFYASAGRIMSARHLYNVRYVPGGTFTLDAEIDLHAHGVTNFDPIRNLANSDGFTGTFTGAGGAVTNLRVSVSGNAGLFDTIGSGGRVTGLYMKYTRDDRTITSTGTGHTGGAAGVIAAGGILENVTFVSPFAETHIIGGATGNTGGIVGNNSGTIRNVLFLAVAPENNVPITMDAGEGADDRVYFLSGSPVWPDDTMIDFYNPDYNDIGEPLGTMDLWGPAPLSGWTKNPGISEDNYLTVYPYHFLTGQPIAALLDDGTPGWPVAGGATGSGGLVYYELYTDGSVGYATYQDNRFADDEVLGNRLASDNRIAAHEGYALYVSLSAYTLIIDNGDDPPAARTFDLATAGGAVEFTFGGVVYGFPVIPVPDEGMAWIHFPNGFWDEISAGTDITLTLRLAAGISTPVIDAAEFNPLFAPSLSQTAFNIRSPRHFGNINSANTAGVTFTQQIHMDFAEYYYEINLPGERPYELLTSAVITEPFAARYNGNTRYIARVNIATPAAAHTGLFAVNDGTIENVTLRDPTIAGGANTGAIAGRNNNIIRSCSVQKAADLSRAFADHPVTVTGTSNVGGVVGNNSGTLTDIAFISTSARPAVTGTSNVGGIAGITTGTPDRLMYLAVAPRTATMIFPFAGSGTVGGDVMYLFGTHAIRPNNTINPFVTPANVLSYNRIGDATQPAHGYNTFDMVREPLFTGWSRAAVAGADAVNPANTVYPYPLPNGTAAPDFPAWPIADTIVLTDRDVSVYYEKYADGTAGVYTRRLVTNTDSNSGYVSIDTLNPYGEIVEAGYALFLSSERRQGNVQMVVEFTAPNGTTSRTSYNVNSGSIRSQTIIHPDYPNLFPIPYSWLLNTANSAGINANPRGHIALMLPSGNGNNEPVTGAYLINPLFAKDLYPVAYSGIISNPVIYRPTTQEALDCLAEHRIRTPWQMQQMSRVIASGQSTGQSFTLEGNLNFGSVTTTRAMNLQNVAGVGVTNRPAGFVVNYTAAAEQNNGVTAVVTASTANIAANSFAGITGVHDFNCTFDGNNRYEGDGRNWTISNLSLTNSTNSKGLFCTIGTNGTVRNLNITNCTIENGTNNGGITPVNNGTIRNVISTNSIVSGTTGSLGGIAGTNGGTIDNTSLIEDRPQTTPVRNNVSSANAAAAAVGGIAGTSTGTVSNPTVNGAFINSAGNNVGGIVGHVTNGSVSNVSLNGVNVTGGDNTGGVAGTYGGAATHDLAVSRYVNVTVNGGQNTGGVAGHHTSGANITGPAGTAYRSISVNVTGTGANIGGVAGHSSGTATISGFNITGGSITSAGRNNVGGIAGTSAGAISGCSVANLSLSGAENVGGIAGAARNVSRSSVLYSTVSGTANAGGIAGRSSGRIEDVYFLSNNAPANIPVSAAANAGGIAGYNAETGSVTRSFYLAPAPGRNLGDSSRTIYPIVGGGKAAETVWVPFYDMDMQTCFYLHGVEHSLNNGVTWSDDPVYNMDPDIFSRDFEDEDIGHFVRNGGMGLYSDAIRQDKIEYLFDVVLANWEQRDTDYLYPLLRAIADVPAQWPITRRVQVLQQNRDFEPVLSVTENVFVVPFENGDFDWPFFNPVAEPANRRGPFPIMNPNPIANPTAADNPNRNNWNTPPQSVFNPRTLEDTSQTMHRFHVPGTNFGSVLPDDVVGARNAQGFNNGVDRWQGLSTVFWHYVNMDWVQGWLTRPVNRTDTRPYSAGQSFGNNMWPYIELQRPDATFVGMGNFLVRTDYKGDHGPANASVFAELNAEVPGTLYQIQDTRPGSEFYYSFYHASRAWNGIDRMTFYLSSMNDHGNNLYSYTNGTGVPGSGSPTVMRPAWTDKGPVTGIPKTRNTITYGLAEFYDPGTDIHHTAANGNRRSLYDVWVGGDNGYGVTFWSNLERRMEALRVNRTAAAGGITIVMDDAGANVTGNTYTITVQGRSIPGAGTGTLGVYDTGGTIRGTGVALNNAGGSFTLVSAGRTRTQWGNTPTIRTASGTTPFIIENIIVTRDGQTGQVIYDMQEATTIVALGNLSASTSPLRTTSASVVIDGTIPWRGVANMAALNTIFGGQNVANNIIGYWDVANLTNVPTTITGSGDGRTPVNGNRISEWKQFYGYYKVPQGQTKTEFAFQSNSSEPKVGNLLDGITFQSTAFMTINKGVFHANGEEAHFAAPGQTLTVVLTAENHGEIRAGDIVITDQLAPFTDYLNFVPNSVRLRNANGTSTPIDYTLSDVTIDETVFRNSVLTVSPDITLARNERVTVEFDITIPQYVNNPQGQPIPGALNMGYFIRNQALVSHTDAGFGKVENIIDLAGTRALDDYAGSFSQYVGTRGKTNASNVIRVDIDPLKLSKTVGKNVVSKDEDFTVTLRLEKQGDAVINAIGTVSVTLAPGFVMVEPPDAWRVNLNRDDRFYEIIYTLRYTGNSYGVARDAVSAVYTYTSFDVQSLTFDTVTLGFPETFIGIKAAPANETVPLDVTTLMPSDEVTHPAMILPLVLDQYLLNSVLREGPYNLITNILLLDENNNRIPQGTYFGHGETQTVGPRGFRAGITFSGGNLDRMLDFTPTPQSGDKTNGFRYSKNDYTLRYIVEVIAVHQGGGQDRLLNSDERTITVSVAAGTSRRLDGSPSCTCPSCPTCGGCICDDDQCCDDCGEIECICLFCPGCDGLLYPGNECICEYCHECGEMSFPRDECLCCEHCGSQDCDCFCEDCGGLKDECICCGDCGESVCICPCDCIVCDDPYCDDPDCTECYVCEDCASVNGLENIILGSLPVYLLGKREWIKKKQRNGKRRAGR